jgi:hypothetical protein
MRNYHNKNEGKVVREVLKMGARVSNHFLWREIFEARDLGTK